MELEKIKNITVGELVEISLALNMRIKEARPLIQRLCSKHDIPWKPGGMDVIRLAKLITERYKIE